MTTWEVFRWLIANPRRAWSAVREAAQIDADMLILSEWLAAQPTLTERLHQQCSRRNDWN